MSHRRKFTPTIIKVLPFVVLLLAFWLQVRYLSELRGMFPQTFGNQPFCGVDAEAHVHRAGGLLDRSVPGEETFVFIPLYPLYLATVQKFWGESLLLPVFLQALLQLVGIAALYGLGRLTFSPLTGVLAALGLATYNYYLFYLPCFDQVLLTTPFLTLAIFFLLKYHQHHRLAYLLLSGISLAVATLSRPTILAVFPVIIIWLYIDFKRSRLDEPEQSDSVFSSLWPVTKKIIILIFPVLIAVSPFTWHNYRVSGRFILLSDNLGVNLFTGNNPDAQGIDSLAHVQSQPAVIRFKELVDKNGESILIPEVLKYIAEQPVDWLALTSAKAWLWFGEVDKRLVSPFFPLTISQSRNLARLPLEWQAMTIAALLGILLAHIHGRSYLRIYLLWLIYAILSVSTIIFFIQLRFRLPFASFVILSAASFLTSAPYLYGRYPRLFWMILAILLVLYPFVPTLWIFILLFLVLGLWSSEKTRTISFRRLSLSSVSILIVVCIYLAAVGIWVRAETLASDISQTIDHYLGPPLVATGVLGQTFEMDCDDLSRIDVSLGVFNREHNQPVTFYLATDTSGQEILFFTTFDGSTVRDFQKRSFSFSPIADSAGRTFFFFLTSPTSTPENAITARGYSDTPIDYYPEGNAWAGQLGSMQKVEADVAFEAYCNLSFWGKIRLVVDEYLGRKKSG